MIRLFKVSIPNAVIVLILSEAALAFACFTLAASWSINVSLELFFFDDNGWLKIGLVVLILILGLYFLDLYENYRITSRVELVQQCCMVLGVEFLVQALLNYAHRNDFVLPKWAMVYGSALLLLVLPLWRIVFTKTVWQAVGARRLLFLGTSQVVRDIIQQINERAEMGLAAIGFLDNDATGLPGSLSTPNLGSFDDLQGVVRKYKPDAIVVGLRERRQNLPTTQLLDLRLSGVYIEEAATTYETVMHRVALAALHPSHLIFSSELGPRPRSIKLQTAYSLLLSIVGVVVASPVMLLVALVVKVTSPGPILFRQKRVGFNGEHFTIYKFRSMRQDAEAKSGAVWATKDDPRITPVGRWLRKLRLDELPQLFNVLRGEMSVVGPRPERPEFVAVLEEKIPYYRQRHYVKPGITGWAQINHKYGDTIEDTIIKLEYDLYYIKHFAVSLDAFIIFHTTKTMLFGRGAQ